MVDNIIVLTSLSLSLSLSTTVYVQHIQKVCTVLGKKVLLLRLRYWWQWVRLKKSSTEDLEVLEFIESISEPDSIYIYIYILFYILHGSVAPEVCTYTYVHHYLSISVVCGDSDSTWQTWLKWTSEWTSDKIENGPLSLRDLTLLYTL